MTSWFSVVLCCFKVSLFCFHVVRITKKKKAEKSVRTVSSRSAFFAMGASSSAPTGRYPPRVSPPSLSDSFRLSVLLIGAPPALLGLDLSESDWRILRSIQVSIVRWDGSSVTGERISTVLGAQSKHIAVVYFLNHALDKTPQGLVERFSKCLPDAMKAAPEARICLCEVIDPSDDSSAAAGEGGPSGVDHPGGGGGSVAPLPQAAPQHHHGGQHHHNPSRGGGGAAAALPTAAQSQPAPPRLDLYDAITKFQSFHQATQRGHAAAAFDRLEYHRLTCGDDLLELIAPCLMRAMPSQLTRPLGSLSMDLMDACGADELYLYDAGSLLPLLAVTSLPGDEDNLSAIAHRYTATGRWLRQSLGPLLNVEDASLRFFAVDCAPGGPTAVPGTVYGGGVPTPYVIAIMFVPDGVGVGEGVIRQNLEHFAEHFANVLDHTSKKQRFTPIYSPDGF